jgi:2-polyprenyl-3-methyl-5-hydroxy-6-metoxy-1,4-benzoquinol methylase
MQEVDILQHLREVVGEAAPDLLAIYDIYAGEARFGRALIADDLTRLPAGAAVLEVGAGALLLSCLLKREGFDMYALEPIGDGFSHFARLQEIVMRYARQHGFLPAMMRCTGEQLDAQGRFDYAFSVNVMEHVGDVGLVLQRVHAALKPGATYRFMCPNYAFPFEPHFNIPTLVSRSLTERLMWRWIAGSKHVLDPEGTWASLNWITVSEVRRTCRQRLGIEPAFERGILQTFFRRAVEDEQFKARRGPFIRAVATGLQRSGLVSLTRWLPVGLLPVMDCKIRRQ